MATGVIAPTSYVFTANQSQHDVSALGDPNDGTLGAAQNLTAHGDPQSIADDDFNNDGLDDLVTADGTDLAIRLGRPISTALTSLTFQRGHAFPRLSRRARSPTRTTWRAASRR